MMTPNDVEQLDPAEVSQYTTAHIENVVRELQTLLLSSMADTRRVDALRRMCGYVEDGSSDCVTLSQDDATYTWVVSVGLRTGGHGESIREAIDDAVGRIK